MVSIECFDRLKLMRYLNNIIIIMYNVMHVDTQNLVESLSLNQEVTFLYSS